MYIIFALMRYYNNNNDWLSVFAAIDGLIMIWPIIMCICFGCYVKDSQNEVPASQSANSFTMVAIRERLINAIKPSQINRINVIN
jgi:hypothetical protein